MKVYFIPEKQLRDDLLAHSDSIRELFLTHEATYGNYSVFEEDRINPEWMKRVLIDLYMKDNITALQASTNAYMVNVKEVVSAYRRSKHSNYIHHIPYHPKARFILPVLNDEFPEQDIEALLQALAKKIEYKEIEKPPVIEIQNPEIRKLPLFLERGYFALNNMSLA